MASLRKLSIVAALVALAAGVPVADAATVTVGSPFTGNFTSQNYSGYAGATAANIALGGAGQVGSPVAGTVVSWRLVDAMGTFRLRILRPAGPSISNDGAIGAGTSAPQALNLPSATSPSLPASLPIRAGDILGIDNLGANDQIGEAPFPQAKWAHFITGVPDGSTAVPAGTVTGFELGVQAAVRYCVVPDVKGKKLKAAKKALAAADCTVGAIRPTSKRARRTARFVKKQGVAAGNSISDTAPIDLKLGKAPKNR